METFALRPTIYFGETALAALALLAVKRVLIVTDEFLDHSGLIERVTAHLPGCTIEKFIRVKPDPSLALVAEGVQVLRRFAPDVVVAFGGGSPMDCAKAMKYFAATREKAPPEGAEKEIPLWCIPTTAGTGSEVTSFAVLTDAEKGLKYPMVDDALLPDVAILDHSLLGGVPAAVTANTGMDVLTHALEAYGSSKANSFTDALAEKAFVLAYRNLPEAHKSSGESRAKEQMLLASCLAGIAFNGAGLGMSHALAHALGGRYHVPHGRLNAMLLPHVIAFNTGGEAGGGRGLAATAEKYAHLARLCGLAPSHRALASALSRLRGGLDMPEKLTACGVEGKTLLTDMAQITAAALEDVCLPTNPRAATAMDLSAILKELV